MLVLDNPGVGLIPRGIVDHGVALVIRYGKLLRLKADAAVFQRAQTIAEKFIDAAGVDNFLRDIGVFFDQIGVVGIQPDLHAGEHFLHHGGVAADGNALIAVVEIIVVIGKTAGQTLDDESGQLLAVPAPLLLRVVLDQLGVDICAHQTQRLLLQIFRFGDVKCCHLLRDLGPGLCGCADAPHFGEGVHVKGKVVQLVLVDGDGTVDVVVEFRKLVYIIPHFFVAGVENVRAILMYVDTGYIFRVDIARNMIPAVNHQTFLALFGQLVGKDCAVQAGSDNQIIIHDTLVLSIVRRDFC